MSLLPATDPRCFRIRGGNSQLAPGVLRVANATVACPAAVASVRRLPDGTFQLELGQDGGGGPGGTAAQQGPFDAVIIATPLEASGLSLQGIDGVPHIPARKYQQTVTTIIKGAVRPSYFGLSDMTYCERAARGLPTAWHACAPAPQLDPLLLLPCALRPSRAALLSRLPCSLHHGD